MNTKFVFSIILFLIIGTTISIFNFYFNVDMNIEYRKLSDNDILDGYAIEWLQESFNVDGISIARSLIDGKTYFLLINNNIDKDMVNFNYINITKKGSMLKIELDDKKINSKTINLAYFIVDEKIEEIKILHNGKKSGYNIKDINFSIL